jgi:hypothetical protein
MLAHGARPDKKNDGEDDQEESGYGCITHAPAGCPYPVRPIL